MKFLISVPGSAPFSSICFDQNESLRIELSENGRIVKSLSIPIWVLVSLDAFTVAGLRGFMFDVLTYVKARNRDD